MVDVLTKKQRSYNMSKIHARDTKPELLLGSLLRSSYLRYQPIIYGKPDFGSKKNKIAIFVDGCFWHGCKRCKSIPKTNTDFWTKKINSNQARDKKVNCHLKKTGYRILRVWEHDVKKNPRKCADKLLKFVQEHSSSK